MKRIFPRNVFTHVMRKILPLHQQSDKELNENLKVFYAEVQNHKEEDYGKSTLLCLRKGVERHLNFRTIEEQSFLKTQPLEVPT